MSRTNPHGELPPGSERELVFEQDHVRRALEAAHDAFVKRLLSIPRSGISAHAHDEALRAFFRRTARIVRIHATFELVWNAAREHPPAPPASGCPCSTDDND